MKKRIRGFLTSRREKLLEIWERVVIYYMMYINGRELSILIKLIFWMIVLILKIILTICLKKVCQIIFCL